MESIETPVRYTFKVRVQQVKEIAGEWFVEFVGFHHSLFFGTKKPDFDPGDYVRVSYQRIGNESSRAPIQLPDQSSSDR